MAQIIESAKKTTEYTIKLDAEEAEGLKVLLYSGTRFDVLERYHLKGLLSEFIRCQELERRSADFEHAASLTPPEKDA